MLTVLAEARARREPLVCLALLFAVLLSVAAALGVRVPEGAGLGFSLARHGPHLLLALLVGAGFGASGVVQAVRDPSGRAHALLLAVATGAAFGGVAGVGSLSIAARAGFALGALAGALLFAAVVFAAWRVPGARRLATGLVLVAMLGAGLFAAVEAKGDPTGLRPVTWWLLGDLSRARWLTAVPVALAIAALGASLVRALGSAASLAALDEGARRRVEGRAALLFGLCLGAAGLVAFFSLIVAVATRWLLGPGPLRVRVGIAALAGALGMVWADALPRALFGGLAPPLGLGVAAVAIPWLWLRNDGDAPRPVRAAEVLLGLGFALFVAGAVYLLNRLAVFIA